MKNTLLTGYRYDPLDRLTAVTQSPDAHQCFYLANRLATEIHDTAHLSFFRQGEMLIAQTTRQNEHVETTLLATELGGSVLHAQAEEQGTPYTYSPYGHHYLDKGLMSVLRFNGERPDPMTGHYLLGNGYRTYNPTLMRFNSPDSLSPFSKGGINTYAYCKGDPINFNDPSGHIPTFIKNLFMRGAKSTPQQFSPADYLRRFEKKVLPSLNSMHRQLEYEHTGLISMKGLFPFDDSSLQAQSLKVMYQNESNNLSLLFPPHNFKLLNINASVFALTRLRTIDAFGDEITKLLSQFSALQTSIQPSSTRGNIISPDALGAYRLHINTRRLIESVDQGSHKIIVGKHLPSSIQELVSSIRTNI